MQPDPHRPALGRIVVEIGTEAGVPQSVVRTEVASEFAVSSRHVEGQDLGTSSGDHLPDQSRGDVAAIHSDGKDRVRPHSGEELGPWA